MFKNRQRVAVFELVPSRSVFYVASGLKEPTFCKWSRVGPQLALGSSRGGVVIFRRDSRRTLPIAGKHSGAIVCGDWSRDGRLALGGAEGALSLSTADGDAIDAADLRYPPVDVQFASQKTDSGGDGAAGGGAAALLDPTVSVNMSGKSVLLYSAGDPEHPVELAFQARYGRIVAYRWFGDGYMLLGFSEGHVVIISTHMREVGEEVFSSGRLLRDALEDVAMSPAAGRAADGARGSTAALPTTSILYPGGRNVLKPRMRFGWPLKSSDTRRITPGVSIVCERRGGGGG
jgi:WD repeat-containing protein 19